ncbi:MAG: DUF2007 domain-containing protein [Bacteroidales bacterium]|nr:DUF2007 domain-containing protein [Bacteroidales bacterium]
MTTLKEVIAMSMPTEAHMVQGYLASEGIESVLKDENITQIQPFYSNAVGGVKLLVREEDVEVALQVLEKGGYLHPEKVEKVEVVYRTKETDEKHCPFCQSENVGKKKVPDVLMLLVSVVFGAIFPVFRRVNKCFDCGKEWVYRKKPNKR